MSDAASAKSSSSVRAQRRRSPKEATRPLPEVSAYPRGRYFNRDESWLLFNERVLQEAEDGSNPLLERVKFLAITSSNLDEFLEIRVAGILQLIEDGLELPARADEGGLTREERLSNLRLQLHAFTAKQVACWQRLEPALAEAGVRVVTWKKLRKSERLFASKFFNEQVDPLLTPVTLDPSHPFPRVLNKALCLALLLRVKRKTSPRAPYTLGIVTIPRSLPSLLALPEHKGKQHFLPLEEIIEAHADTMFRGYRVLSRAAFRVTRNSNLYMQEEESRSLLESVREELHNRRKGDAVLLEIDASAADEITDRLRTNFELDRWQIFPTDSFVNLARMMDIYSSVDRKDLKFPEFHGRKLTLSQGSQNIFDELQRGDLLLHHPFDTYDTVEKFIEAAQADPQVVSIRQTLYRTSANSPIFRALKEAGQSKETTVVVELMARFDEASNIRWARELEDAGVQVFHGLFGQKTHCKLALLVRRDADDVVRSYAHLGSGNYNPVTARFYTDVSFLTSRPEVTSAVQSVFRYLTAEWQAEPGAYRPLLVAPITLAQDILDLIARETEHARAGRPARIIAKMNALLDGNTIEALYTASLAGVEIDLIVRGMCALRPQVHGLSERIRVRSIVGRFLEHSRIFYFENGGRAEIFAGSADWMPRNLHERCEVVFPVTAPEAMRRLRHEILEAYLRDNVKARTLEADGLYHQVTSTGAERDKAPLSAQDWLMAESKRCELKAVPRHAADAKTGSADANGSGDQAPPKA